MIYPTARAVILAALGAPLALLAAAVWPAGWLVALAWMAMVSALVLLDAAAGPARAGAILALEAPTALGAGATGDLRIRAAFEGAAPRAAELAVEVNDHLAVEPATAGLSFDGGEAEAALALRPLRRGPGEVLGVWMRWRGTLGLVWKQVVDRPALPVPVTPDIEGVKGEVLRLFSKDAVFGLKAQLDVGEGSEFHALHEVEGAIDPRTIDWKQSARHARLLAKEFRTERNHPVVFAIDTGRAMGDPLLGVARLDRAINAALILAYVCLKAGDFAAAYGFAARPGAFSGILSGPRAYPRLQRHLAALDYGSDETNYTLGLTQLGAALSRRSLIVVFTEFADTTSAELMIENLSRLARRHVILFVVMRDEELEAIAAAEPATPEAVSRAVTAAALLKSRDLAIARIARLGATIVDAPAGRIAPALISAYLDLKRSERV